MKVKVSDATVNQLNWMVAICENRNPRLQRNDDGALFPMPVWATDGPWRLDYATSWSLAGPIIEREGINIRRLSIGGSAAAYYDFGGDHAGSIKFRQRGQTALIAAMRCYAASKLGDEVDIPEELA